MIERGEERRRRSVLDNMSLRRWQKGNKNLPHPHYVPGSVLGAGNTVVNNTDTLAKRSVGPELRTVAWTR